MDTVTLKANNMVGVEMLSSLLKADCPLSDSAESSLQSIEHDETLAAMVDELAKDDHGLIMLMGKGGVGKTTLAASIIGKLS